MRRGISRRQFLAAATIAAATRQIEVSPPIAGLGDAIEQVRVKARVPGLAFALIRNGHQIWSRGFGVKDARTNEPVKADTVFAAGSLTKPIFAYAVLALVEQKLLGLDTTLPSGATPRMLLSHSANGPAGRRFEYSPAGFRLLQSVIERLTGKSLSEFMRVNLLEPFGMTNSSFEWTDRMRTVTAVGHFDNGTARDNRFDRPASAAASLLTTAEDYSQFVAEILQPSRSDRFHISDQMKAEMLTPQVKVPEHISWGLGWGLETTAAADSFWHWGDQDIFQTFALADPKRGSGIVILTNSRIGTKVYEDIISAAIGGEHPSIAWIPKTG
jgi:CubicO group peptidase (beta-lactamase class C family)